MTVFDEPEPAGRRTGGPSIDTEAEKLLAELYADRIDDVADDLVERLTAYMPAAADRLGHEFHDDVIERASRLLRGALHALTTGESLEPLGPSIEQVARQRREQQLSQEMIFFGYRFLQQALFERIADDVRDHPEASRILGALALRQLEFQWMVTRRVAAAFDTGPEVVGRNREESMQTLLETLVGIRPGPAQLDYHATNFGLLLPLDRIAVTVPVGGEAGLRPSTDSITRSVTRSIARTNPWAVVGALDGRAVVLSRGLPFELDLPWAGSPLAAGAIDGTAELAGLVERASVAADVVAQLGLTCGEVDELAPFAAVAGLSPASRDTFLRSCFGPLHDNDKGRLLLEAVAVSARCASRKEAAQELHVHPNTLDYRLARFRELTGLDVRRPVDRMRCDLGLFLTGLLHA